MTALRFVDHLFRSDVRVAIQPDDAVAGAVEQRGRFFWAALVDESTWSACTAPEWIGTRCTLDAAQRLVARKWGRRFGHE